MTSENEQSSSEDQPPRQQTTLQRARSGIAIARERIAQGGSVFPTDEEIDEMYDIDSVPEISKLPVRDSSKPRII